MKTVLVKCFFLIAALSPASSYAQGLIPETRDSLAGVKRAIVQSVNLPVQVDLSPAMPAPGHQGPMGSCVAWAVAYARAYYQGEGMKRADSLPSPSYLFRAIVNRPNQCDSGSQISTALHFLRNHGALSLAAFPYNTKNCGYLSSVDFEAGKDFRIFDFEVIANEGSGDKYLNDMKAELAAGNPLIVSMRMTDAFDSLKRGAIYNYPTKCKRKNDRCDHAVVIVGYDERRQAFKLLNSWGSGWADGGFGWIGYQAAKSEMYEAFIIRMGPTKPNIISFRVSRPRDASKIFEGEEVSLAWEEKGAESLEIVGFTDLKKNIYRCECPDGDCGCKGIIVDGIRSSNESYGWVRFIAKRSGSYTLRAENQKGVSTMTIDLVVNPRPPSAK